MNEPFDEEEDCEFFPRPLLARRRNTAKAKVV
jgi:hypothetical protein